MCEEQISTTLHEVLGDDACDCSQAEKAQAVELRKARQKKLFNDAKNQVHFTGRITKRYD